MSQESAPDPKGEEAEQAGFAGLFPGASVFGRLLRPSEPGGRTVAGRPARLGVLE